MGEDVSRRFTEVWEAFRRLQDVTDGLDVGSGRYVLIPPADVRLSAFRAKLSRRQGVQVTLQAEPAIVKTQLLAEEEGAPLREEAFHMDLTEGYMLDGHPIKHPTVLARALLDRMEALLQNDG